MSFEFDSTITLPLILALASMVFAWWRTRRGAVEARFKEGRGRMDRHDLELARLSQEVASMPAKDDLHKMQLLLAEMGGDLKAIRANMRAVADAQDRLEHIVTRHEDYLRENGT